MALALNNLKRVDTPLKQRNRAEINHVGKIYDFPENWSIYSIAKLYRFFLNTQCKINEKVSVCRCVFVFLSLQMLFTCKKKRLKMKQNLQLFLHLQVKFEIIWTRIDQVILLRNDKVVFPKIPCTSQMISKFENIYITITLCSIH